MVIALVVWGTLATLVAGVAMLFASMWHDDARRAHARANAWRAALMRSTPSRTLAGVVTSVGADGEVTVSTDLRTLHDETGLR